MLDIVNNLISPLVSMDWRYYFLQFREIVVNFKKSFVPFSANVVSEIVTICLIVLVSWAWLRYLFKKSVALPGPRALPIIGNLLDIGTNAHLKFSEWALKYGKLFQIKLGTSTAIVLSDPKVFREILNKPAALGRFKTDTYLIITNGRYGMVNTDGKVHEELSHFCSKKLESFGIGSQSLEPLVSTEANKLIKWIDQNKSEDGKFCMSDVTEVGALNTLWTLVTGQSVPLDDTRMSDLVRKYVDAIQIAMKSGLLFYSRIRYIAPQLSGYNALVESSKNIQDFIKGQFDEHRRTIRPGHPRDLIDLYLEHLPTVKDPESAFYGEVGNTHAMTCMIDLFLTGGSTISNTIVWAIYYLCTHQQVQNKLKEEIYNVVGAYGECTLMHKAEMPYAEVVMLEVLRKTSLLPLGVFNETIDDLKYDGAVFPKGTIIIPNIYHIHNDRGIWGDPENFRPERFLQKGREELRQCVMAFQPGRRTCVGEPLARDMMFLLLVKIVQHFEVVKPNDIDVDEFLKPEVGFMLLPGRHSVIFKVRKH